MHSVLLVPMYLDALCLTKSTGVREALVDYSGLPFTYEQGGSPQVHPLRETPNLSENILSPPFTSSILELPPGIHLHWALPDTLAHSDEGDSAGNRKFPIVPNRWLIIRRRNGNVENQWVVESDYLHPDLSVLSAQPPDAVTVPFSQINPASGPYQPFRHMGRKVPQSSWTQNDPNAEYLKQYGLSLTSVGPFDQVNTLDHIKSSFAAFYPNCFSVFGFRDDDPSAYTNPQGLAYDVIGWYGDPSQDFMGLWYTQNPDDLQTDPSAGCAISSTEQMPLRYPTPDDCRIRLLPRLAQAARVSFRWLSAEPVNGNDEAEMNAHPATSPICGWVLPNNLDNSLMIYEADGGLLGLVDSEGRWRSAPGRSQVINVEAIRNPHLRGMVQYLTYNLTSGEAFTSSFLSTLDDAIQNINPEDYAQHKAMALLVGRPLALVRATVSIELKGQPARDEGWELFLNEVQAYHANGTVTPVTESPDSITQAFQGVRFPIRIGEFSQYNDGLAGYWLEDGQGGYAGNVFYAPQSDNEGIATASGEPRSIQTAKNAPVDVLQAPGDAPRTLALLVDPRGRVHATSGVLPTKAIAIPADQYADAMAALEVTFLSAPLMTTRATYEQPPDQQQLQAALPQEGGYAWSWLNNLGGNWLESANFTPPDTTARFAGEQLLCEGWLKLSSTETSGNGTRE